ncbi:MAG: hypothetical protein RLZZ223_671 [Candidatus Parcubacteria bacterium]|jgi:micrococcal nuclease
MKKLYIVFIYCIIVLSIYLLPQLTLARQVSIFPNGLLIRAVDRPTVYYIDNGSKRKIESPNMLISQFRWQDVVIASPVEVDAIPEGQAMTYADGSLLYNDDNLYVISGGKRRQILSPQVIINNGYKEENIIIVSKSELLVHPEGAPLQEGDLYPDGSLLSSPKGEVYKIQAGTKRYIPSPLIFESRYKWASVIPVSQEIIDKYPRGADEYYPDGLLISNNTTVFLMQNNQKRPIVSPEVFESYGFNWRQIRKATDYEMSIIPEGPALSDLKSYRSRSLVSPVGSSAVYVVDETGDFRYIPSPFVFEKLRYRWSEIIKIPARSFNKYKTGANAIFKDGEVVSYNGSVYLIANGKKRPISSPNIYFALGYKWSDVIPLRLNEFIQYPFGTAITDIQNELYNIITVNDGDDIVVNLNGKIEGVKLLGIDAPEKESFVLSETCFGIESYQALKSFIANNRVKLVRDPAKEDRDDNNRLLRYVYLEDGRLAQEYMLKEGFAKEYTYKGAFYQNQNNHKNLEQEAKQNKKGLWSASCNLN